MSLLALVGAGYVILLLAFFLVCVAATIRHVRGAAVDGEVCPMTVIRPVKGLSSDFEANLRALLEADREGRLQIIVAVDSDDDPALARTRSMAAGHPGRDLEAVVTGPSGGRVGKVHAMTEAIGYAKHAVVVFSDADVVADRALLVETSRAFAAGADGTESPPAFVAGPRTLGSGFVDHAFHLGMTWKALVHQAGGFHFFAAKWMAYRREALDRIGGLSVIQDVLSDDYFLSVSVRRAGGKMALNRNLLVTSGSGLDAAAALRRVYRWLFAIRHADPLTYFLFPLGNPLLLTLLLWKAVPAVGSRWAVLACACAAVRAGGTWAQDRFAAGRTAPAWSYLLVALYDLAAMGPWLAAAFGSTIAWNGKSYRLLRGGRCEPA